MPFNSLSFLIFLPAVLFAALALPQNWRWPFMVAASAVFYGYFDPCNLLFLAGVIAPTFTLGLALRTGSGHWRKVMFVVGVAGLIAALFAFKFLDFFSGEAERLLGLSAGALPRLGVAAPAGFSFYVFGAVSYLVDVRRGDLVPERDPIRFSAWVSFFPKLLAGPIERAGPFLAQLRTGAIATPVMAATGLQLILWGLFKKVVIADNLALVVDRSFSIAAFASPVELLISVYFFAFQIYCDFSGYSDIAIGVALLLGIRLSENFRRPYLARDTAEFWASRWHITLGHWFRDYLYFPLGGSRAGPLRRGVNLMAVFVASGLWHAGLGYGVGWNFLVWGALNGLYQWAHLALAAFWRRAPRTLVAAREQPMSVALRIVVTFHLIALSWIFFRAQGVGDALIILRKVALVIPELPTLVLAYPFTTEHAFGGAMIALLVLVEVLDERRSIIERLATMPTILRWASWYAALAALLLAGQWQLREFIYMRF